MPEPFCISTEFQTALGGEARDLSLSPLMTLLLSAAEGESAGRLTK